MARVGSGEPITAVASRMRVRRTCFGPSRHHYVHDAELGHAAAAAVAGRQLSRRVPHQRRGLSDRRWLRRRHECTVRLIDEHLLPPTGGEGKSRRRRLWPGGSATDGAEPSIWPKLGNGRTTVFSPVAMWLARNPEQSSPGQALV
jgi:hypothetical protein